MSGGKYPIIAGSGDGKRASGDSRALDVAIHSVSWNRGGGRGGGAAGAKDLHAPPRKAVSIFLYEKHNFN